MATDRRLNKPSGLPLALDTGREPGGFDLVDLSLVNRERPCRSSSKSCMAASLSTGPPTSRSPQVPSWDIDW